jgi:polyisoprenoid-binding protein YceI
MISLCRKLLKRQHKRLEKRSDADLSICSGLAIPAQLLPLLFFTLFFTSTLTQAASYTIDPTHTFATFEINHFNTSTNRGRFDKKEGTLEFDRAARTGKIKIDIFTASINSGTVFFDKFLTGFSMFDSATFPTARFEADQFKFEGDKVNEVTGNFTLLGKTHPLTLKATNFNCYLHPMLKREVCGGDFEATFDRSLYGMNYGLIFGFPKNVHLLIQVEAIKDF